MILDWTFLGAVAKLIKRQTKIEQSACNAAFQARWMRAAVRWVCIIFGAFLAGHVYELSPKPQNVGTNFNRVFGSLFLAHIKTKIKRILPAMRVNALSLQFQHVAATLTKFQIMF